MQILCLNHYVLWHHLFCCLVPQNIDWVQTEKRVFDQASNHPFLVGLHFSFQTDLESRYVAVNKNTRNEMAVLLVHGMRGRLTKFNEIHVFILYIIFMDHTSWNGICISWNQSHCCITWNYACLAAILGTDCFYQSMMQKSILNNYYNEVPGMSMDACIGYIVLPLINYNNNNRMQLLGGEDQEN